LQNQIFRAAKLPDICGLPQARFQKPNGTTLAWKLKTRGKNQSQ
jgi:hypothetical protein